MGQLTPSSSNSVRVTCVDNAIDIHSMRRTVSFPAGHTLQNYVDLCFPEPLREEYRLIIARNTKILKDPDMDIVIHDGEDLIFAIAPGYEGLAAAGAWLYANWMAAAAIAIAAGSALYSYFSMPSLDATNNTGFGSGTTKTAYSWEDSKNYDQEGAAWPVLYGTTRITPIRLAKYINCYLDESVEDGNKQYLHTLYGIADHPIDSMTGIEINGDAASFYTNVALTTDRLGAYNQLPVPGFEQVAIDVEVNQQMTTSFITKQTSGNIVEGIIVTVMFPKGLYAIDTSDNGTKHPWSREVTFEYRAKTDNPDAPWTLLCSDNITANSSTVYRKSYKTNAKLPADQWEVRGRAISPPTANSGEAGQPIYVCDMWWEALTEVTYDSFAFPGASVLGVQALATDTLNGTLPKVTLIASRLTVPVWNPTLPIPAYENKPANNPAWASYDTLHNEYYGAGISHEDIIYEDFEDWANFCDKNGYTCNIYLTETQNLRSVINTIALLGRGVIVQKGKKYTVIVDRPHETPVRGFLFNNTNIAEDSFKETWAPYTDRFNVLEMTYEDAKANYAKQTFRINAPDFETTNRLINVKSVEYKGCTDRQMAIKFAKYLMNRSWFITLGMQWDVDIDAIGCMPGNIIEIAHDRPAMGKNGRVVSATSTTIALDQEVELYPNETYCLVIRRLLDDSQEYKTIVPVEECTLTDNLILANSDTWDNIPQQFDLYAFGMVNHTTKLARVKQISRSKEFRRSIVCEEYINEVYDDNVKISEIEDAFIWVGVMGLSAHEVYTYDGLGGGSSKIAVVWRGTALRWYVHYKLAENSYRTFYESVTTPHCDINGLGPGTYDISVSETQSPTPTSGNTRGAKSVQITYTGLADIIPAGPTSMTATVSGTKILLKWSAVDMIVNRTFNIYCNDTLVASNITDKTYLYDGDKTPGEYIFEVKSVDPQRQESEAGTVTFTIYEPNKPTVTDATNGEIVKLTWSDCKTTFAIDHYEVNGIIVKDKNYSEKVTWLTKEFEVKAVDVVGNESDEETIEVDIPEVGAVTAMSCIGKAYGIEVDLTYSTFPLFQAVEIYASKANDRSTATKIVETTGPSYTHTGLGITETWYYWTKIRNQEKMYGAWYPTSSTAGALGNTSSDPTDYLAITNIDESHLSDTLRQRIDWIDSSPFVFSDDYVEPDTVSGLNGVYSALAALATEHDGKISVAQQDIEQGKAGEWASITSKASTATVEGLQTSISNAEQTIAAGVSGTWASITSKATTVALDGVTSRMSNAESAISAGIAGTWASISDKVTTSTYNGLVTRVGSAEQSITSLQTEDGNIKSQWTVKLNTSVGNRHYVSGVGLMLDSSGFSEFAILATKFLVCKPDNPDSLIQPFAIDTSKNPTVVGINGNLIVKGTVLADALTTESAVITGQAQIANAIIKTAHIDDLQVTQGKIANLAVGEGQIANAAIKTAKIDDLQVSTIKIAGNAVTIPVAEYTAGSTFAQYNGGSVTLQTLTTTTFTGQPILVMASCMLSPYNETVTSYTFKIFRDSTVIYEVTPYLNSQAIFLSVQIKDTPASGDHTYSMAITAVHQPDTALYAANRSLLAMEVKK
ncbi:MAG: hypothetical protein CSYNP_01581 [Syntrophus sp. SKADARSKE-3]|nr:hypothetical protein [Syntrophus sp. SKADARSKE-3]